MRRILVENARRKARVRHGRDQKRVELKNSHSIAEPQPYGTTVRSIRYDSIARGTPLQWRR
jgi:hypothetical protein